MHTGPGKWPVWAHVECQSSEAERWQREAELPDPSGTKAWAAIPTPEGHSRGAGQLFQSGVLFLHTCLKDHRAKPRSWKPGS